MKKKVWITIAAVAVVLAVGLCIYKPNNEQVDTETEKEVTLLPVFYENSETPVLNDVPKGISFVVTNSAEEVNYQLFDNSGNQLEQNIEQTENGYTIKAPQEGYTSGETYHLVLGDGNTFADEKIEKYSVIDFKVERVCTNTIEYNDNVKETTDLIFADDNTVNVSGKDYQTGDIIFNTTAEETQVIKIESIDENGNAIYVKPSLSEIYKTLDLSETFDVNFSDEYLNELNDSLNDDETLREQLKDLFFEELNAKDDDDLELNISVERSENSEESSEWIIKITGKRKGSSETQTSIEMTVGSSVKFNTVFDDNEKYIEEIVSTNFKCVNSFKLKSSNTLEDVLNSVNEKMDSVLNKTDVSTPAIIGYVGPFNIYAILNPKIEIEFTGEIAYNATYEYTTVNGVKCTYDENGEEHRELITGEEYNESETFDDSFSVSGYIEAKDGFELEIGVCFVDPDIAKICVQISPEICAKLYGEGSKDSPGTFDNVYLEIYAEVTIKIIAGTKYFDDNFFIDDEYFPSLYFEYTICNPKYTIAHFGNDGIVLNLIDSDLYITNKGVYIGSITARVFRANKAQDEVLKPDEIKNSGLIVLVRKANSQENYTVCELNSASNDDLLLFTNEDIKFEGEYEIKIIYNTKELILSRSALNEKKNVKVSYKIDGVSYADEIEYNSLYRKTLSKDGYNFIGWYKDEDFTVKYEDTPIIENTTLYPKFEKITYTVYYFVGSKLFKQLTVEYGDKAENIDASTDTMVCYGWYKEKEYTNKFDFNTLIFKDTNVYGYYSWCKKITFVTNCDETIEPIYVYTHQPYGKLPTPTRTGYTFVGWLDKSTRSIVTETSIVYESGSELEAQWNKNKYDIEYYIANEKVNSETVYYGHKITYEYESDECNFIGWYLDEQLTKPFDSSTPVSSNMTLYGKTDAIYYLVSFETNGGSQIEDRRVIRGTSINDKPSKEGYTFNGWYLDEKLTQKYNKTGIKKDTTLYAGYSRDTVSVNYYIGKQLYTKEIIYYGETANNKTMSAEDKMFMGWFTNEQYTTPFDFETPIKESVNIYGYYSWSKQITFNPNNGESNFTREYMVNEAYGTLPTPTKTGHTFGGWKNKKDSSIVTSSTIVSNSDDTLEAVWITNCYSVKYIINGKTVQTDSVFYNTKASCNYTSEQYNVDGYYRDAELTQAYDQNELITCDTTIYIKVSLVQFTVTFETNGGTAIAPMTVDYGSQINKTAEKTGYTFAGWYTDSALEKEFANDGVKSNLKLYAKYDINKYDVIYYVDGSYYTTKQVEYKNKAISVLMSQLEYNFGGWFSNASCTNSFDFNTEITATTYIYGYYKKPINISFNGNGGNSSTKSYTIGNYYTNLPTPSRECYTFNGWYTQASGGTKITANTVVKYGDSKFYAHWTQNEESGWINYNDLPANCVITAEKWEYTKRIDNKEKDSCPNGVTPYDQKWVVQSRTTVKYVNYPSGYSTDSADRPYQNGKYSNSNDGKTKIEYGTPETVSFIYYHWVYPRISDVSNTKKSANYKFDKKESTRTDITYDNTNKWYVAKGLLSMSNYCYRVSVNMQSKVVSKYKYWYYTYATYTSDSEVNVGGDITSVTYYVKYRKK